MFGSLRLKEGQPKENVLLNVAGLTVKRRLEKYSINKSLVVQWLRHGTAKRMINKFESGSKDLEYRRISVKLA
jgi:TnpA family transposase